MKSAGEFFTEALWGLACLFGMIVMAVVAIIMSNKEE